MLPGFDLTPEQLFFVSFARTWCTKTRPEALMVQVMTNPHRLRKSFVCMLMSSSPGPFRVLGTLQNSPEFAKAFKCQRNSKMNVRDKCTLWWRTLFETMYHIVVIFVWIMLLYHHQLIVAIFPGPQFAFQITSAAPVEMSVTGCSRGPIR